MKLELIRNDIKKLERALKLVESTENYYTFDKSKIILCLLGEIHKMEDKISNQIKFLETI
jgi:hypothetical protein